MFKRSVHDNPMRRRVVVSMEVGKDLVWEADEADGVVQNGRLLKMIDGRFSHLVRSVGDRDDEGDG